ncbi:TetR-like C-terminal domain-containing protein, partial [Klebsiella pneumoniae]|uniref:TetR-like C-terminal domain-containing protein n=1 Tax=Klebsiella pneumoniae TaxID=573 RepID=UPI003EDF1042
VIDNPTHFRVISDRTLIDFDGSASLRADNAALQAIMTRAVETAQARGLMPGDDIADALLTLRGLSYGLARMLVDGHLPQWGVPDGGARAALTA